MSRKITLFYVLLIAVACLAVGMVIASRLDLSPESSAQSVAAPARNGAPLNGPMDAGTFRNIAKAQNGVVVSIRTESRRKTSDMSDFMGGGSDLFQRFFGMPDQGQGQGQGRRRPQPREQVSVAAGSGFIISKDGYILTNNHVVEGATKIFVQLFSDNPNDIGNELKAKIVGRDPLTDSALIQLEDKPATQLPEAKFGDSSQMQPGDWVMAIGNPFGYAHTVTVGVISAARPGGLPVSEGRFQDVLQTDAAINPGNSGGPLLNMRGEVIGINTAILSENSSAGNVGIGFAIPINVVAELLPQLRAGKITRGRIGVTLQAMSQAEAASFGAKSGGALVSTVEANSPGQKAGLEPGDVIVEYNGKPIKNRDELIRLVTATKPGTTVPLKVVRDGKERSLSVTPEELDLEKEQGAQNEEQAPEEAGSDWGMRLGNVTPDIARRLELRSGQTGAVVMDVDPYSSANKSGLQPGDVITRINGQPVTSAAQAGKLLNAIPSGGSARLLIWRRGQEQFVLARKD
ncbi:MAG: Do family serine endopeptidase [Bacteroidales bacterium]